MEKFMIIYRCKAKEKITKTTKHDTTEEKNMTIKSYADVLRWAIQNQISYVQEEANSSFCNTMEKAVYYEGIQKGLEIALEKIDASMFLAKE